MESVNRGVETLKSLKWTVEIKAVEVHSRDELGALWAPGRVEAEDETCLKAKEIKITKCRMPFMDSLEDWS